MEFKIIPDEQTPKTYQFTFEIIKDYIEKHRDEFLAFLEFAKTKSNAVGLAANQCALDDVRFMRRVFALCDMVTREWRLVINPYISEYIGIKELKGEGCLTWKGKTIVAERYRAVEVNYYDIDGNYYSGEIYKGFEGQIWQHEVNHLNGVEEDVRDNFLEPKPIEVGRNELCPCGSNLKYKKCCLLLI